MSKVRFSERLRPGIPDFNWIRSYHKRLLSGDILAGITVAMVLIPQCMAYAMLAGLPPQFGLYSALLPMLFYSLWGTSPYLSVAPVAITSIIVGVSLGEITHNNPELMIQLVPALAVMEGVILLVMGVARMGFIVNFISHPVLSGYITASAITTIVAQLGSLLGVKADVTFNLLGTLINLFENISSYNLNIIFISVLSLGLLFYAKTQMGLHLKYLGFSELAGKLIPKAIPLLLVMGTILLTWKFSLHDQFNMSVVGHLPSGLPELTLPTLPTQYLWDLLPLAATLSLLTLMSSYSVGKVMAYKEAKVLRPNRELFALGAANIASSVSGGYSVSGSLTRSTLNYQSGANTKLSGFVTVLMVTFTVLFLMNQLFYLPKVILAAILVAAVSSMIDFKYFFSLYKLNRIDTFSFAATFLAVFVFGVKYGLIVGVVASMIMYVWITSRPHIAVIGRIGQTEHFRNILRHEVTTHPHILTVRIDENLTFANSKFFEEQLNRLILEKMAMEHVANIKHFVLVTSNINYIDTSALETLEGFFTRLENQGIDVMLAEVKGPVMDFLKKSGFTDRHGSHKIFLSTHLALKHLTDRQAKETFSI